MGGTLTGLGAGKTVVLVLDINDALDFLTLNVDGPYTFSSHLLDDFVYIVDVNTQPFGQTCTVANGFGVIAGADATNVNVTCTTAP